MKTANKFASVTAILKLTCANGVFALAKDAAKAAFNISHSLMKSMAYEFSHLRKHLRNNLRFLRSFALSHAPYIRGCECECENEWQGGMKKNAIEN